ncbi:hypothetical protein PIB30_075963 [Stylosanthes scabra]|uniref:Uncharacterized protein n=1 Tax=Stylosanthes scabra TaxID=79078 RepID=A0ABU6XPS8_9FABA|nr:hypothetical protein [Stylosanthes scabra]
MRGLPRLCVDGWNQGATPKRGQSCLGVDRSLSSTHMRPVSRICVELGFKAVGVAEATGHKGGIWVLAYEAFNIPCKLVDFTEQCVTLDLWWKDKNWIVSVVHGSSQP